jgi:hypothetical protein
MISLSLPCIICCYRISVFSTPLVYAQFAYWLERRHNWSTKILDMNQSKYINKHHLMSIWRTRGGLNELAHRIRGFIKNNIPSIWSSIVTLFQASFGCWSSFSSHPTVDNIKSAISLLQVSPNNEYSLEWDRVLWVDYTFSELKKGDTVEPSLKRVVSITVRRLVP